MSINKIFKDCDPKDYYQSLFTNPEHIQQALIELSEYVAEKQKQDLRQVNDYSLVIRNFN